MARAFMADGYLLSEADRNAVRALLEEARQRGANIPGRRGPNPDDYPAPEVYVARSPDAGIPAMVTEPGTGTPDDDVPGAATCDIYRVLDPTGASPNMASVGLQKRVYNLSTTAVSPSEWVLVARDKFGSWFVTGMVSSASGAALNVEYDDGTGDVVGVGNVQLDKDDFVLSSPAGGTARIRLGGLTTTVTLVCDYDCTDGEVTISYRTLTFTDGILTNSGSCA